MFAFTKFCDDLSWVVRCVIVGIYEADSDSSA